MASAIYEVPGEREDHVYLQCEPESANTCSTSYTRVKNDNFYNRTTTCIFVALCLQTVMILALIGISVYLLQMPKPYAVDRMTIENMTSEVSGLKSALAIAEANITNLAEINIVMFTAKNTASNDVVEGVNIIFPNVLSNEGGGYDFKTGDFTAPYNGLYSFTTTICATYKKIVYVYLVAANTTIAATVKIGDEVHYSCKSISGIAVLGKGDTASVRGALEGTGVMFKGQLVGGCPGGFHPHEEKCYFVSTAEGSWADAMKTCQSQGGQLALVTDQETQIFLAGLVEFTDKKSSVSYHTGNDYVYHYLHDLGVNVMGHTSVTFNVRACHDAHIALSRDKNNDSAYTYEIVIGGWSGSQSVIRDCKQCQHMDEVHHQSHPVSCTDQRPFWISWAHNVIRVGTGNDVGVSQFMAWNDTDPHAVNYVAIATGWSITGDWTFPLRTYMPGKFWVGATDLATEGEWLWLPDQTLIRAFTDWAPGEPNPGPGVGRCLVLDMHNNMQWRADTCEEMRNFICEKERQGDVSGIIG